MAQILQKSTHPKTGWQDELKRALVFRWGKGSRENLRVGMGAAPAVATQWPHSGRTVAATVAAMKTQRLEDFPMKEEFLFT